MSILHNNRGDAVRVESNKDLQVFLNTESRLEVPFELINLGKNEVFISPSYVLPNGNYTIGLRTKKDEVKLRLAVEKRELLEKK